MIIAPEPENETERLATVKNLQLLETRIEERFERITRLLCHSLNVPIAAFSLIDKNRQWFKSAQGLKVSETSRDVSFCTHVILDDDVMVVPDAKADARFSDNPLVTGNPNINFYAGCPVHAPDGHKIGALCAIDTRPRQLSEEAQQVLRDLGALVETELRAQSLSKLQKKLLHKLGEAERMALVDPLTRLWNRNGIFGFMKRSWSEAKRRKAAICIVMGDIDHFKKINDGHGHPAGDAVLQAVSRKLLASLRTEDAVGRIGGEEFLIVLTSCSAGMLKHTVDRIRQSMAATPTVIENGKIFPTMSFGAIACHPDDGLTPDQMIKYVDEALYEAKRGGRNQVVVYNPQSKALSKTG